MMADHEKSDHAYSDAVFTEYQRFHPLFVSTLLAVSFIVLGILISVPGGVVITLVTAMSWFVIIGFLITSKMRTVVRRDGIHINLLGFVTRFIPFGDLVCAEAVRYRPILDYGGWGIRIGGKGRAYNMRGNEGVQLVLKNQRRILVGSQKPVELAYILNEGMKLEL